jgi:uncharacterized protein with FMN-binding domain
MSVAAAVPVATALEMISHVSAENKVTTLAATEPQTSTSQPVRTPASQPTATAPPVPTQPAKGAVRKPAATAVPKPTATAVPTTRTYTGTVAYNQHGGVQATITVTGKKITDVSIAAPMDDPRSAGINQQADPILVSETLTAQSANINIVSGATDTSQSYMQSLQSALDQAKL